MHALPVIFQFTLENTMLLQRCTQLAAGMGRFLPLPNLDVILVENTFFSRSEIRLHYRHIMYFVFSHTCQK